MHQHTLRDVLEFEGVGLHTGAPGRVRIRPQVAGSGLRFRVCLLHFAANSASNRPCGFSIKP